MIRLAKEEIINEKKELPEVIEILANAKEAQIQGKNKKAISLYNKAIKEGSITAPNLLGELYFNEFSRPNRKKILDLMLQGANAGDIVAQKNVGLRLQDVEYVKKVDYLRAFKYLYSAASQGNADAAIAIAYLYISYKIEKDEVEAAYWAEMALDDVYDEAMNLISHLTLTSEQIADYADQYFYGSDEVHINYNKAFRLFHIATLKENPSVYASAMLGFCYYAGKGTHADIDKAKLYLQDAFDKGNQSVKKYLDAIDNLLKPYKWDDHISITKEKVDLDEAAKLFNNASSLFTQKKYQECMDPLLRAAKLNCGDAYAKLGSIYANGFGVNVSEKRAYKMYKAGAELGNAISQYEVARLCEKGIGCEVAEKTAFFYMYSSATQGNPLASRELCRYYRDAIGCKEDHLEAFYWLFKTLNSKDKVCQDLYASLTNIDGEEATKRGNIFYMGKEAQQDFQRAFAYYFAGAEKADVVNPACLFNLGLCYYYGRGTDVNYAVALQYAKLAKDKGYKYASQLIEKATAELKNIDASKNKPEQA